MNNKSKKVGYTLAFFLGGIGAHAFYYRKYVKGTVYFLFSWTTVPILLGWIDMFFIKAWHDKLETIPLIQNSDLRQKETQNIPVKKETNHIPMDDVVNKNRLARESVQFSDERPLNAPTEDAIKREELKSVKQVVYAAEDEQQRIDYTLKSELVIKLEETHNTTTVVVSPENKISSQVEKNEEIEETVIPTATPIPAPEGGLVERFEAARRNKTRLKKERDAVQQQNESGCPLPELQAVLSTPHQQVQQLHQVKEDVPPAAVKEVQKDEERIQEAVENVDLAIEEEEHILSELVQPSTLEEPSVNIAPERKPKNGFLSQASMFKRKIEETLKTVPDINIAKLNGHFYNEDAVILDKYRNIETPREILKAIEQIKRGNSSKNTVSYGMSFSHNGGRFIKHSLGYATKRGIKSPEVPVQVYWTTFDSLNEKQQKWYFYWREQVLNGKYLDVDLSYVILFAYELMNYSFNQRTALNISMMVRLHDNYLQRLPKVKTYIAGWTADMLREVGENDLAEEWIASSSEVYMMPLYKQLMEKQDELERISFTTWKPYIQHYKETVFFTSHKHKIYKIFKGSFPLLQDMYQKQGEALHDRYFEMREERTVKNLYISAVMGRETDAIHVQTNRIQPTARINDEVTSLFRLAENVTRLLNGEKRQLKVDESFLPEGFKEIMMEHFTPVAKETSKRFKIVQKAESLEGYGTIPPPPEDTPVSVQRPVIEFNNSNIKAFQEETEELIAIFNTRSTEEDTPVFAANADTGTGASYLGETTGSSTETYIDNLNIGTGDEEVDPIRMGHALTNDSITKIETTIPTGNASTPSDIFLALGGGGSIDGEEEFLESLTAIEKGFLVQFEKGVYDRNAANTFLKQKGIMLGMFISEINEKANEYLGDNFLESQAEEIAVYEEFKHCILMLKGIE